MKKSRRAVWLPDYGQAWFERKSFDVESARVIAQSLSNRQLARGLSLAMVWPLLIASVFLSMLPDAAGHGPDNPAAGLTAPDRRRGLL